MAHRREVVDGRGFAAHGGPSAGAPSARVPSPRGAARSETGAREAEPPAKAAWVWPVGIVVGLLLVITVNAGFIYLAVTGADEVVPSYAAEER